MKLFGFRIGIIDFTALDHQIGKIREIRDSYRAANIRIYGTELARLLDEDGR